MRALPASALHVWWVGLVVRFVCVIVSRAVRYLYDITQTDRHIPAPPGVFEPEPYPVQCRSPRCLSTVSFYLNSVKRRLVLFSQLSCVRVLCIHRL